jgi:uncharacterized lipoprotein YddW (UPF0748 family)
MILLLTLTMFASQQRGLWLRAMSIADSTKTPRICAIMDTLSITDVYIQAVVGGYAYYDSRVLPRSEVLVRSAGPDYLPFETMYRICKDRGVRVHAWVNALLAWSLEKRPDSASHVLNLHPDWFLQDVFGRRMSEYSYRDWRRFGIEGLFLDPANPAVREYIADIVRDIGTRYEVDGIHLDFIRYPGIWWSLEPAEQTCLLAGMISDTLQWMTLVRYCQLPFKLRWMTWNIWRMMKSREENIDSAVSQAFDMTAVSMKSCAVTANPASARYKYGQSWWQWRDLMDFPVLMSYTQDVGLFQDMTDFAAALDQGAVMGIGVIWPGMEREAAYEQRSAARRGAGFCFFDFESLDTLADLSTLSDTVNIILDSLALDSSRYRPVNSVFADRPAAVYGRSGGHYQDSDSALEFVRYIMSLSLNQPRDLRRLGLDAASCACMIRSDIAAFEYVNDAVFPLGTMLFEPRSRLISYDSLCWSQGDSDQVRKRISRITLLYNHRKVYPVPFDRFAKSVFSAKPGVRTVVETPGGMYAFAVDKTVEDSVMLPEFQVPANLRPVFSFNTAMIKFDRLLREDQKR